MKAILSGAAKRARAKRKAEESPQKGLRSLYGVCARAYVMIGIYTGENRKKGTGRPVGSYSSRSVSAPVWLKKGALFQDQDSKCALVPVFDRPQDVPIGPSGEQPTMRVIVKPKFACMSC